RWPGEIAPESRKYVSAPLADLTDRLTLAGVEIDTSPRRIMEYSYDASNYRVRPRAVVFPRNTAEARVVLRACHDAGLAVTLRGGGTSMAGNSVGDGVVVDLSRRMQRIDQVDSASNSVWVDAGVVLSELRARVEQA